MIVFFYSLARLIPYTFLNPSRVCLGVVRIKAFYETVDSITDQLEQASEPATLTWASEMSNVHNFDRRFDIKFRNSFRIFI